MTEMDKEILNKRIISAISQAPTLTLGSPTIVPVILSHEYFRFVKSIESNTDNNNCIEEVCKFKVNRNADDMTFLNSVGYDKEVTVDDAYYFANIEGAWYIHPDTTIIYRDPNYKKQLEKNKTDIKRLIEMKNKIQNLEASLRARGYNTINLEEYVIPEDVERFV